MAIQQSKPARRYAFLLALAILGVALSSLMPAARLAARESSLYGDYLAGRFAVTLRDNEAAAAFYRDALRKDPVNEVILERAFVLELATGDIESATRLATRLVKVEPEHRLGRLVLAVRAIRARQYATARRHIAESAGDGPVAEMTKAMLTAWSFQGAGDLKSALETLESLDSAEWMAVYRSFNSALIAELSGNVESARQFYEQAYKLDGTVLRIVEAYARFAARNDDTEKAEEILQSFRKVVPGHPLIDAVSKDLAAKRVPSPVVADTISGAAGSLYEIGALLSREGGQGHAIVFLQLALYLDPDAPLPLLALADLHGRQTNHELAAAAYNQVPEESPLYASAQIERANSLNAMDKFPQAREILDGLIERDPTNMEAMMVLGDLLRAHNEFDKAAAIYGRALAEVKEVTEREWTIFYFRGISYEQAKKWDLAEKDLKRALELNANQPFVLNYLGYSWIDKGINLTDAMEMIRKAVELRPDDGFIVDSLGWAHYRLGEYEAAVEKLERAVELMPEDPIINDHLGDAYWRAGRKLEARFQWRHARDLEPKDEELAKILNKLKEGLPDEQLVLVSKNETGGQDKKTMTDAPPPATSLPGAEGTPSPPEETKTDMSAKTPQVEDKTPDEDKTAAPEQPPAKQAASVEATTSPAAPARYVVQPGDSLWWIAKQKYGAGYRFQHIFEANRDVIGNANRIFPGQSLIVPDLE